MTETPDVNHMRAAMEKLSKMEVHRDVLEFYRAQIAGISDCKVLDLGAGGGKVALELAKHSSVIGVIAYDKSPDAMRGIPQHPKIETCSEGSHLNLPFAAGSFDVVVCRYAFHHFDQKPRALHEANRVLKVRGLLLLSDAVMPEYSGSVLNPIYRFREDHFFGYCGYFDLIRMLEDAGFRPLLARPYRLGYNSFTEYLNGVDGGFEPSAVTPETVTVVKWKIARAWGMVDERVREEMRVTGQGDELRFQYYMLDLAARKEQSGTGAGHEAAL